MNSLERVTMAMNHQEPDHVPVYPLINSASRKSMGISYEEWTMNPEKCAKSILMATKEIGVDIICSLVDLSLEAADWGQEIMFMGDEAACPVQDNRLIKEVEDYDKIDVIDPRETPRMSGHLRTLEILCNEAADEYPVVAFVFGPLGILSMMRGQVEMFMDMYEEPESLYAPLRAITDTLKVYIKAICEKGVHAVMFDTLYASQSILSPQMWQTYEEPYIKELSDYTRECGAMVMLHNCGDGIYIKEQYDAMKPVLVSLNHEPPECATMEDTKKVWGDKITICGQIDPGFVMTTTEDKLRAECRRQIDAYKKDGGYILATGCEYPSSLDYRRAQIMVEEARTYGKY